MRPRNVGTSFFAARRTMISEEPRMFAFAADSVETRAPMGISTPPQEPIRFSAAWPTEASSYDEMPPASSATTTPR